MDNQYHNLLYLHCSHLILNNQLSMMQMLKIFKMISMSLFVIFYFSHLVLNALKFLDNLHMFVYHNLHKYRILILKNVYNLPMLEFHLENVDYLVVMIHPIKPYLFIYFLCKIFSYSCSRSIQPTIINNNIFITSC